MSNMISQFSKISFYFLCMVSLKTISIFVGFVTTTRVTHATPSALYAHIPNRNWECESKMPASATKCKDIAKQLIEDVPGKKINVSVIKSLKNIYRHTFPKNTRVTKSIN